jgi:CHAT domain-containing protein
MLDLRCFFRSCGAGLSFLLLSSATIPPAMASPFVIAASPSAPSTATIQQGQEQFEQGQYQSAIDTWNNLLQTNPSPALKRLLHRNLAQAYKQIGQTETAIEQWENLIKLARQQADQPLLTRALIEQAQAYSAIGRTRTALTLLCDANPQGDCSNSSALTLARSQRDPSAESAALGSLGDTHRLLGEYDRANELLKQALTLARNQQNQPYELAALNSLGNNARSLNQRYRRRTASLTRQGELAQAKIQQTQADAQTTIARDYFQQTLTLATQIRSIPAQVQAELSLLSLSTNPASEVSKQTTIARLIAQLPANRERVYSTIDLARYHPQPLPLLKQAIQSAQSIHDQRSESFALGALGHWYEQQGDLPSALQATQQAILAADRAIAKDSRYQWEWQMARILRSQRELPGAIAAYEQSIATMESIRSDLLSADRNLQFDFRDSVEPIYRELIDLRFQVAAKSQPTNVSSSGYQTVSAVRSAQSAWSAAASPTPVNNLGSALVALDSLRLAELQNYFGSDCLIRASEQTKANVQDDRSAVVRSIILDDRLISVLSVPNQPDRFVSTDISRKDLEQEVIAFRQELETYYNNFPPDRAQRLYRSLIQPFETALQAANIETLVFVNDGILRSLPMAALHDGQQFLIEKYAIATTPSLSLTNTSMSRTASSTALAAGMTQDAVIDGQRFAGLENVSAELAGLEAILPGSRILKDADFTQPRLREELAKAPFPIIHLATHGQFGAEAEDTFLVLGDQQKLSLNQLDRLIRNVSNSNELIDLLTLTACKTAVGDDRAALGLAGIAIQAGAKSAIASLWSINDSTTLDFSQTFYQNLKVMDKAKALQAAQIKMLRSNTVASRPAYWAPYVLVGSWR